MTAVGHDSLPAMSEIEIEIGVIEDKIREVEGDAHHPLYQTTQPGDPKIDQ